MPTKTKKLTVSHLYTKLHQADRTGHKLEVTDTNGISYRIDSAGRTHGTAISDSGVIVNLADIVDHRLVSNRQDSFKTDSIDLAEGKKFYHCDSYPLKHWELDNVGNLRFISPIARTGDLIYLNDQGIEYPEFVPETTLVNSLDSFKTKAVTLLHPPEKVTPANSMKYQRGLSGYTGFFDGKFLWLTGTATDQQLINAIKTGRAKEISPGYDALIKQDGKRLIQASREGNHLAAVPRGRNGRDVAFKVDSAVNSLVLRSSLTENDLPEPPKQLWARWV